MNDLITFRSSISPDVERVITTKLAAIEAEHAVRVLFAVESGSRGWGFPSPDSDYDVRFVYVHERDWYLRLRPGRDVIELPLEGDWDINGWDLRKALTLLIKPNPVMLEWLSSPIRYRWSDSLCPAFQALAERSAFGAACRHHYARMARAAWDRHIEGRSAVNLKKYAYCLRPAMALDWLRTRPDELPPMNLQAILAGLQLDADVMCELRELLALKAQSAEVGLGPRRAAIDAYVREQIDGATTAGPGPKLDLLPEAEALFLQIVAGG